MGYLEAARSLKKLIVNANATLLAENKQELVQKNIMLIQEKANIHIGKL